jgi:hypothetical protein
MITSSVARALGAIALAGALLAGAIKVQAMREREYPAPAVDEDAVYITSGTALRRLSGAYNALAADLYWIRAVQYYGAAKRRLAERPFAPEPPPMLAAVESTEYSQLYTLLDITTTLDPRFDIAYRFGSVFLAEAYPVGAGRADLAVKLLEKGFAARPDKWEYLEDIGFVYYWFVHDYRQAAAWFQRAGRRGDAGAGRRSSILAGDVGENSTVRRHRVAAQIGGAPSPSVPRARSNRRPSIES